MYAIYMLYVYVVYYHYIYICEERDTINMVYIIYIALAIDPFLGPCYLIPPWHGPGPGPGYIAISKEGINSKAI